VRNSMKDKLKYMRLIQQRYSCKICCNFDKANFELSTFNLKHSSD